MESKQSQYQQDEPVPVPLERHYEVVKGVELDVKRQLSELDYDILMVGLRVSYGSQDADEQSFPLPHRVEFGYIETLDCALEREGKEMTEEEWTEYTKGQFAHHPLPIDFLTRIYQQTKAQLEESAGRDLAISVDVVLYGSPMQGYSVGCQCPQGLRGSLQYVYYDKVLHVSIPYCPGIPC